jgi:hypothetical protein
MHPDTEEAFFTPDGQSYVAVANRRAYDIVSPSKRTSGESTVLVAPYARVSPDGRYAALFVEARDWRVGWDVSVVGFSDHAELFRAEDASDAFWIGDATLLFRSGKKAMRVTLPAGTPEQVGPEQKLPGCEHGAALLFEGSRAMDAYCQDGRYTRIVAATGAEGAERWLVADDLRGQDEALRSIDLSSGKDRIVADAAVGSPLDVTVSPLGSRYCALPKKEGGHHLLCGTFPDDDGPRDLLELGAHVADVSWLDEDRLLISGLGLVDLAAGKKITFEPPTYAATLLGGLGPRYVVVEEGHPKLLDLEQRSRIELGDPTRASDGVFPEAFAGGRLWVGRVADPARSAYVDLMELQLPSD